MSLKSIALIALSTGLATIASAGASGSGETTRYWDCCKGSCSWAGKASVSNPVTTCDASDNPLTDYSVASACNGGSAYMCSDQSPWAVNDTMAYGFAAVNIAGGTEDSWCCACYKLTFTSTSIAGKTMIVQATNTGADLGSNQFDLAIPGGGVGIYNACTDEFDAPSSGWGAQYGGISSNTCSTFPTALQPGCDFRFDWFEGADNPSVTFEQVSCPAEITAKTGCVRDDDTSAATASTDTSSAASSSSAAQSSSTVASSSAAASSSSIVNANTAVISSSSSSAVEPSSAVASSASSVEYSSTVVASSAAESSSSTPVVSSSSAAVVESSSATPVVSSSSVAAVESSSAAPVAYSSTAAAIVASSSSAFIPGASQEACVVEYVYADDYDL